MSLHAKYAKKRREELERQDSGYAKLLELTHEIERVTQLVKKGVDVREAFRMIIDQRKNKVAENDQSKENRSEAEKAE